MFLTSSVTFKLCFLYIISLTSGWAVFCFRRCRRPTFSVELEDCLSRRLRSLSVGGPVGQSGLSKKLSVLLDNLDPSLGRVSSISGGLKTTAPGVSGLGLNVLELWFPVKGVVGGGGG